MEAFLDAGPTGLAVLLALITLRVFDLVKERRQTKRQKPYRGSDRRKSCSCAPHVQRMADKVESFVVEQSASNDRMATAIMQLTDTVGDVAVQQAGVNAKVDVLVAERRAV